MIPSGTASLIHVVIFAAFVATIPGVSGQGSGFSGFGFGGIPLYEEWTSTKVKEETELGNAEACYFAILTGPMCGPDTVSGVYKITKEWYKGHYGGSYALTTNGCGTVIESWPTVHPMVRTILSGHARSQQHL
jgi:hypothetical protein